MAIGLVEVPGSSGARSSPPDALQGADGAESAAPSGERRAIALGADEDGCTPAAASSANHEAEQADCSSDEEATIPRGVHAHRSMVHRNHLKDLTAGGVGYANGPLITSERHARLVIDGDAAHRRYNVVVRRRMAPPIRTIHIPIAQHAFGVATY